MSNPIDTAAKGLAQSQAQLATSAKKLVQSAVPQAKFAFEPVQNQRAASAAAPKSANPEPKRPEASTRPTTRFSSAPIQGQGAYIPSMAEETVQMRMAANAYKSNASILQAAEDVLRLTQEAVAPKTGSKDSK